MSIMFDYAKEQYAAIHVDVEAALEKLKNIPVSLNCWQGDDVKGFEHGGRTLTGGIQVTGDHAGRARTFEELTRDFDEALCFIPGKKRINLHASYLVTDEDVDRDQIRPEHFQPWVAYAKARGLGIDFNPTFFSHPMVKDGLTLSSPNEQVRAFWVRHGVAARRIAAYFAGELGTPCLFNVWIADGLKDFPGDRITPRRRLKDSLDQIFAQPLPGVINAVESKVFGIGLEAYTVGSSEFYISYAAARDDVYTLIDNGHYHPTENVADKLSALLVFKDKVPMHVTRPMRWDSDHVVSFDDGLRELASEIVRCNAEEKVLLGLDFFDGSINRVAAWAIGARNMQKALLCALLEPKAQYARLQDAARFTELLALQEEAKTLPFSLVWDEYLRRENIPGAALWLKQAMDYEADIINKRG